MKKKSTEISVNTSSGAEKVEKIEREIKKEVGGERKTEKTAKTQEKSAKGSSALGGQSVREKSGVEIKKINARSTDGKAEKESAQAKARVEKALARKKAQEEKKAARKERAAKKAEERKKRIADFKAKIAKRSAEKKARAEKHAAERKALAEKRKAEKEERIRERARAKANRNNENYKKKQAKEKTKSSRREKRGNRGERKGYGGWIAAVVSLGAVTLALGTTVTVGAIEMSKNESATMGGYRGTMYELTGIMDNVDDDLDRVRISNSPAQQSRILTDLLVQARLAEMDLEKLPIAAEADSHITSFINRTARFCEGALAKLRKGEPLSAQDREVLEKLYEVNHTVRMELDELNAKMTDKEFCAFVKKGEGRMQSAFDRIEKATLEENAIGAMRDGKPAKKPAPADEEKGERPHIEAARAEALCAQYFTGYNVGDFQCIGETVGRGYEAYNVQGYDERGNQLFAEVSQVDGALLRFDYYEECGGENFDVRNAERIAEEFLEKLGYDDMEAVRLRANGSNTDFTFVYEDDGVAFYPDEIRIKVCRTRGVVSGFDATRYLMNHKERDGEDVKVGLTLAQAYKKLREGLSVEASRLTVIQTVRGERSAYEFLCGYGEESYFVFLDAVTGEEISIVNVKTIA